MKHTTLTPPTLKIAIVSAILGLGAVSGANAQSVEYPISSIGEDNQGKMVFGDTFFVEDQKTNDISMKFYSDSEKTLPNSMLFDQILTNQILNGFKEGQPFIPVDKDGKIISQKDQLTENGTSKDVRSVTTKIATADDVANSPYANGIQKDIDDLYSFDQKVTDYLEEINIYNERQTGAIDALNKASSANTDNIANNINNIYELAQQQDQHSSDIKTLAKASAANKADADASFETLTKNQNTLIEKDEEHDRLIAQNQADIANNIDNIYELAQQQDQHSSDIKNLGKASLTNTKRITTAELGIAENKKDALIAKKQANQNKADITTNKADITKNKTTLAQHTKKIDDNQRAIEAKLSGKVDAQKLVDLEKRVKQNQDKQDKVGETLTTVQETLTSVQENYSQLNTQVQSVDNKIGMVDTRVNALDDKVENSMAAQAALNGLFQPYNVGKVSVSVAVGAYGSKSAIAVGAGYRVNPHLAFKGGAAINTSGSRKGSYNLGINYEF